MEARMKWKYFAEAILKALPQLLVEILKRLF